MKPEYKSAPVDDQLERLREEFAAGDKSVLLTAIGLVLRSQPFAPTWVADAVQDAEEGLNNGRYADINKAFGWTTGGKKKRGVAQRQAKNKSKILAALVRHRLAGGSMNEELAFRPIADELTIPWRDVRDVYRGHGKFIKMLPRRPKNDADTYSFGDVTFQSFTLSATAHAGEDQPAEL